MVDLASGPCLQNTALGNFDIARDFTAGATVAFDFLDDIQSLYHFTKDDVFTVEPRSDNGGNEELGTIRVGTSVSHGEQPRLGVLQGEVLIRESGSMERVRLRETGGGRKDSLVAVDRLATRSVTGSEVTTLEHELRNDTGLSQKK